MVHDFKIGDHVEWNSEAGRVRGTIKKKHTAEVIFKGYTVHASKTAIFHFMTHAFFKALLFLAAGFVIDALHDEHSIFRMDGLRTRLRIAFWTFAIAGCSLSGLPLITAGAFSKDWIIWGAWSGPNGSAGLWIVALTGVMLTTLYTFRVIFLIFFGEAQSEVTKRPGKAMLIPCFILAFLSVVSGYVKTPFARFLETVLPWTEGIRSSISVMSRAAQVFASTTAPSMPAMLQGFTGLASRATVCFRERIRTSSSMGCRRIIPD